MSSTELGLGCGAWFRTGAGGETRDDLPLVDREDVERALAVEDALEVLSIVAAVAVGAEEQRGPDAEEAHGE